MLEICLLYAAVLILGWPLGHYLAAVMRGDRSRAEPLFDLIEKPIYAMLGKAARQPMSLRQYLTAFVACNAALGLTVWLIFMFQGHLPWNPNHAPDMSWDLALHTAISFLTNTNQQHYSGQAQLSLLSQASAITGLQVASPLMGLAMACCMLRLLFGRQDEPNKPQNFWVDIVRPAVRLLLPAGLVLSVLLTSQGVPATLSGGPQFKPLDTTWKNPAQVVPLGPVAPMVAVKQLGTNGGGWYGPNSAVPLENPTPLSNFLETLAILLMPVAVVFMVGPFTGRKRLTTFIIGVMIAMSIGASAASIAAEHDSPGLQGASWMEGKEQRFNVDESALWSSLTTQTSNGSVNAMMDSMAPLTILVALCNMMINSTFGGVGCGLLQFFVYLMLTVFLAGLMTGRTPELFGRKIEAGEIRWLGVLILLQPLTVLGLSAITFSFPGLAATSNPGFHGFAQVLYEYTSAFANNGSGLEGLGDNTVWWNVSASVALLLGRFPSLMIPVVLAWRLSRKPLVPENAGSLQVESITFGLVLIATILILTLLQFTPALMLGPIADHFALTMTGVTP
ncbi:potassium-transporting ATPase subunit KdpA [Limnobacter sp.]|uniref:potassium-transporting ATPase subunit KdpA n=1 Tax=Limnobacter sp. TaxID=2003368 RepID=UPI00258A7F1F|nr:potassium-transporting ATPase subunit KdpA [Limnobacter sp.]